MGCLIAIAVTILPFAAVALVPSFMWLESLMQMLAGHPLLHLPLYTRLWELLHLQVSTPSLLSPSSTFP